MTLLVLGLIGVSLLATSVSASGDGATAAAKCSQQIHIRGRLFAVATVLRARNMTCRNARRVVRRNGRDARPKDVEGSHFRLGRFRCTVVFVLEESRLARCRRGERVFRVDYGS